MIQQIWMVRHSHEHKVGVPLSYILGKYCDCQGHLQSVKPATSCKLKWPVKSHKMWCQTNEPAKLSLLKTFRSISCSSRQSSNCFNLEEPRNILENNSLIASILDRLNSLGAFGQGGIKPVTAATQSPVEVLLTRLPLLSTIRYFRDVIKLLAVKTSW